MGICDYISWDTKTIVGGAVGTAHATTPYLAGGLKNTLHLVGVASEYIVWTGQAGVQMMANQGGLERITPIGRVGLRVADHAINLGTRPYTGGIPVYNYVKEELLSKNYSREQPKKDKKDQNMELSKLIARIESLEKESMELQQLKLKMENILFEMKLVESKQNVLHQKAERRPKLMYWSPPESVDFICTAESTENLKLSLII